MERRASPDSESEKIWQPVKHRGSACRWTHVTTTPTVTTGIHMDHMDRAV
jgi:hypothetical protein